MRLAVLAGALAACSPDLPEPIWKGERLHYATTTPEPVCRGSFLRQERHAVEMARALGFELPAPIQYTRVARSEIAAYCEGLSVSGCAYVDEPRAFSASSIHFHEVSHVVAHSAGILGATPLAEGLAQVFSDGREPDAARAPIEAVLGGFAWTESHYYTMALFTRFVVERHDLAGYVQWMRATADDADYAAIAAAYAGVFGEPLAAAIEDFAGYPSCTEMSNRIAVVDCALPLTPWDGETVEVRAAVRCEDDEVLGPTTSGLMFTTRGFAIEQAGAYGFQTSAQAEWTRVRVVKCGSCRDSFDVRVEPGELEVHALTPGRYYVMFGRAIEEPGEVGVVISRM